MYKRGNSWYSDFWNKGARYFGSHGSVSKTTVKEKNQKIRADVASGEYVKLKKIQNSIRLLMNSSRNPKHKISRVAMNEIKSRPNT